MQRNTIYQTAFQFIAIFEKKSPECWPRLSGQFCFSPLWHSTRKVFVNVKSMLEVGSPSADMKIINYDASTRTRISPNMTVTKNPLSTVRVCLKPLDDIMLTCRPAKEMHLHPLVFSKWNLCFFLGSAVYGVEQVEFLVASLS